MVGAGGSWAAGCALSLCARAARWYGDENRGTGTMHGLSPVQIYYPRASSQFVLGREREPRAREQRGDDSGNLLGVGGLSMRVLCCVGGVPVPLQVVVCWVDAYERPP